MRLPTPCFAVAVLFALPSITVAADAPAASTPTTATAPAAPAEPMQLPAWMSGDVIEAAVAIHMSDAQQHAFNEAVGDYVTDHFAMVQREARREAPDLERRVHSRDNSLLHHLDDRLHKVLTAEQWPAYKNYRKVLQKELKTAPLPQQSGGTRAQPGVGGGQG